MFQVCFTCLVQRESGRRGLLAAVSHPLFHIRGDTGFHGDAVGTGRAGAGQSSFQGNSVTLPVAASTEYLRESCPAETNPRLTRCIPLCPPVPSRIPFLFIPLPFTSVTTAMSLVRCSSGTLQHPQTEPGQSWGSQ